MKKVDIDKKWVWVIIFSVVFVSIVLVPWDAPPALEALFEEMASEVI